MKYFLIVLLSFCLVKRSNLLSIPNSILQSNKMGFTSQQVQMLYQNLQNLLASDDPKVQNILRKIKTNLKSSNQGSLSETTGGNVLKTAATNANKNAKSNNHASLRNNDPRKILSKQKSNPSSKQLTQNKTSLFNAKQLAKTVGFNQQIPQFDFSFNKRINNLLQSYYLANSNSRSQWNSNNSPAFWKNFPQDRTNSGRKKTLASLLNNISPYKSVQPSQNYQSTDNSLSTDGKFSAYNQLLRKSKQNTQPVQKTSNSYNQAYNDLLSSIKNGPSFSNPYSNSVIQNQQEENSDFIESNPSLQSIRQEDLYLNHQSSPNMNEFSNSPMSNQLFSRNNIPQYGLQNTLSRSNQETNLSPVYTKQTLNKVYRASPDNSDFVDRTIQTTNPVSPLSTSGQNLSPIENLSDGVSDISGSTQFSAGPIYYAQQNPAQNENIEQQVQNQMGSVSDSTNWQSTSQNRMNSGMSNYFQQGVEPDNLAQF